MKKILLICLVAVLALTSSGSFSQNVVHSTLNGGLWTDPGTWIESVPTSGDSVVIQGPVSMLSYTGHCSTLNILSAGSLGGNGNQGTLYIEGSIHNSGTILGTINFTMSGNIHNYQPWTGISSTLKFTGSDHFIYCAPGASINAQLFADDSLQNLILQSDVILNTSQASVLSFSELLAGEHKLTIDGGELYNCRLHSMDTLQISSNVSELIFSGDYILSGNLICYMNVELAGEANNSGTIQFASGIGGNPLRVSADLVNNGTMTHAWVQVLKSVVNHGDWNVERTEFLGPGTRYISHAPLHPFKGNYFLSDNSGLTIQLMSDVELNIINCSLGDDDTISCGGFFLKANSTFNSGTILSQGFISGISDYWNVNLSGDFSIDGLHRFSNSTLNGQVQNTGVLKDISFYGGIFKSYGHLINLDTIEGVNMNLYGNLTNEGKIYNNAIINVSGNTTQYILLTQAIEAQTKFYSNISGTQYQWMLNGEDIPTQIYDNLYFSTLQLSDAGIYQCRVITSSGTEYSREIIVNNSTTIPEKGKYCKTLQAIPNPFKANTTVVYELESPGTVMLSILDCRGSEVRTLPGVFQGWGIHEITIEGSSLKQGIYILRMVVISEGKREVSILKLNHI